MERLQKLKGWQRLWVVLTCLALIGAMLQSCNLIYGNADFSYRRALRREIEVVVMIASLLVYLAGVLVGWIRAGFTRDKV